MRLGSIIQIVFFIVRRKNDKGSYSVKNLTAITGNTVTLKSKSENARDITNGVVTCLLIGV